jgi:CubicO group peptidase (beta-lactamase class C family)
MNLIQNEIQKIMDERVASGKELGLQFCAYQNGSLLVDACAGIMAQNISIPVNGQTLFPVFSTGKGIVATAAHLLAERDKLKYDMKICELWPEFAVNGKENATIRHALYHLTGIPHMPEDITQDSLADWDYVCAKTAGLTPKWTPGTKFQYHPVTFGWVVGEILRRLDGRPVSRIIEEELCKPLGIERDLFIGLPDEETYRVATLYEPGFDASTIGQDECVLAFMQPLAEWMNKPDTRRTCVPASNGIATANALARFYAALLPGGVDGVTLLPASRIKTATEPFMQADGTFSEMAMGYNISKDGLPESTVDWNFGHGGYGGSLGSAYQGEMLAVGFTKNLFNDDTTRELLIRKVREYISRSSTGISGRMR